MKRLAKQSAVLSAVLFTVGCGAAQHPVAKAPQVPVVGSPFISYALVDTHAIRGPGGGAELDERSMQGHFRGAPVQLDWSQEAVNGRVGGRPTKLAFHEGEVMTLQGTFAGGATDLVLDGGGLYGQLGPCDYTLRRAPGGFRGVRSCFGQPPQPTEVAFPEALQARPAGLRVALLGLLLTTTADPGVEVLTGSASRGKAARRDIAYNR